MPLCRPFAIGACVALLAMTGCGSGTTDQIALVRSDGQAASQLLTASANGDDAEVLVSRDAGARAVPERLAAGGWSPDGAAVAFESRASARGWRTSIFTVETGDSSPVRLIKGDQVGSPVWTPDGESVIYARRDSGRGSVWRRGSVWIVGADGGKPRRLASSPQGFVLQPTSVSPDGATVLVTQMPVYGDPASSAVLSVPVANGGPSRVLIRQAEDAAFSPDGEEIAFSSSRDENGSYVWGERELPATELYVMQADGSGAERLTETKDTSEGAPSWFPGGEVIVYESLEIGTAGMGFGVFRINADGSCNLVVALDEALEVEWKSPAANPAGEDVGRMSC